MSLINGKTQTQIDVTDRGLAYGDGLFETIAYVNGILDHWNLHWQRLSNGAQRLAIKLPEQQQLLKQINMELNASSEIVSVHNEQAVPGLTNNRIVKVIITRGQGSRGYVFPEHHHCSVIVSVHAWPDRPGHDYEQGIRAIVCQTCLARQPALAGIKHLNRLEQVLGRNEFNAENFQEGIMLSCTDGDVRQDALIVEGTSSNLFFVLNGKLCTAKIDSCGVLGTIRQAVISLALKAGIEILEDDYPLMRLAQAAEVFFSNSIYGIVPVASITVSDALQWHYTDRIITSQLAADINKALMRPEIQPESTT